MEELLRQIEADLANGADPAEIDQRIAEATQGRVPSLTALRVLSLGSGAAAQDATATSLFDVAPAPEPLATPEGDPSMEQLLTAVEAAISAGRDPSKINAAIRDATDGHFRSYGELRNATVQTRIRGTLSTPGPTPPSVVTELPATPLRQLRDAVEQRLQASGDDRASMDDINRRVAEATDGAYADYAALVRADEYQRGVLMGDRSVASFGRGASQGVSFGFADELSGLVQGAGALLPGGRSPRQAYSEGRQEALGRLDAARVTNPGATLAGEVTGAVAVPGLGGARGAVATGRGLRATAGRGAVIGAAEGGLFGIGTGEDTPDRIQRGAVGAGTGAVAGGVAAPLSRLALGAVRPTRPSGPEALRRRIASEQQPTILDDFTTGAQVTRRAGGDWVDDTADIVQLGRESTRIPLREARELLEAASPDELIALRRGMAEGLVDEIMQGGAEPLAATRRLLQSENLDRLRLALGDAQAFDRVVADLRAASTDAAARNAIAQVVKIGGGIGLGGALVKSLFDFDFGGGGEE